MSKYDIRSQFDFECQNLIFGLSSKKCQIRILIVKMRYSVLIRMSKKDFECQNLT